jgi:esterase
METTHTLTTLDGVQLTYRRWHAPDHSQLPPLVLLHGAASNMTRWSEFVELTTLKQSRDLVRLDLRGHGQSLFRGRLSLEIWADDLALILEREHVPRAIVGGHCLGANIAMLYAARHPQRTAGLVLVEPMLRPALTGALHRLIPFTLLLRLAIAIIRGFTRLGIYRRELEQLDLRELDREFRRRLTEPGGGEALVKRYASPLHDLKIMPAANFLQDLVEVTRPLPLDQIRSPFLALLSSGRTFADPDITRPLLVSLGLGEIRTLDARHWIPTEQPLPMRVDIEAWCANIR